jgi:Uma2 family endonuclease
MALQLEEKTGVKRHLITLDEYEQMCESGVFGPETHVELIRGEIVDMAPPGPEHEDAVTGLHFHFFEKVQRQALVWPQGNAIRLPNSNSRPQPDVTLLRWRDDLYRGKRPTAEDVILLVEVAYSSLKYDSGAKLALYAEAGIPEYWLVNLVEGVVEVYSNPSEGKYKAVKKVGRGELLQLPGGLEGSIAATDVLGPDTDSQ